MYGYLPAINIAVSQIQPAVLRLLYTLSLIFYVLIVILLLTVLNKQARVRWLRRYFDGCDVIQSNWAKFKIENIKLWSFWLNVSNRFFLESLRLIVYQIANDDYKWFLNFRNGNIIWLQHVIPSDSIGILHVSPPSIIQNLMTILMINSMGEMEKGVCTAISIVFEYGATPYFEAYFWRNTFGLKQCDVLCNPKVFVFVSLQKKNN